MSKRAQEKHGERRFGSSETETDEFGVKEPPERKANLSDRFGCFEQPGQSSVGSEFCFVERQETGARQQPRPNNTFTRVATRSQSVLEHQETGAEW